jgi:hypothetical protein
MAILVVIVAPKGLVGLWNEAFMSWRARTKAASTSTTLQTEP